MYENDTAVLALRVSDRKYPLGTPYVTNWAIEFLWNMYRLQDKRWSEPHFSRVIANSITLWSQDLRDLIRLANGIFGRISESEDALDILESITQAKPFVEVILDPRISGYILPSELVDPSWKLYTAQGRDPHAKDREEELVRVLADSMESAKTILVEELSKSDYKDIMERWRQNDLRIQVHEPTGAPQFWWMTLEEKIEYVRNGHQWAGEQNQKANNV